MTQSTLHFLVLLQLSALCFLTATGQSLELRLIPFASNISLPVDIVHTGDDRLFVVTQNGTIVIVQPDGSVNPTPFLNITDRTGRTGFEQGLLGLAFHPNYSNNGYFYVNYTTLTNGTTHISRFTVSGNPDVANPNSEQILMTVSQPYTNHNAGDLAFGPDGYLYFGLGDGGDGGDPDNRSQNTQDLLGKIIRLDVDNGLPYSIPPTNPFVGDPSILDEIWAIGVRNPWRISFDRLTGDFWMADVGQNSWEEVNWQSANSTGGENYGWRCFEGPATFESDQNCGNINATDPIAFYDRSGGSCSITGGFVYRGSQYPNLYGHYIYTDYCSGNFWTSISDGNGGWTTTLQENFSGNFSTFGEDQHGELYVADLFSGAIYQIVDCSSFTTTLAGTDEDCQGNLGSIDLSIHGGKMPYTIEWSNGSTDEDVMNLSAGTYAVTVTDDNNCVTIGTYIIRQATNCFVNLQLKILLEGAYDENTTEMKTNLRNLNVLPTTHPFSDPIWNHAGTEMVTDLTIIPTDAVDWILIQLVDGQGNIAISKAAFLLKEGSLRDIAEITNPIFGGLLLDPMLINANTAYQIQVYTRNHMAIASSTNILLDIENSNSYDFTNNDNNTLGGSHQLAFLANERWAMLAGDVHPDGIINVTDFNRFVSKLEESGYVHSDLNFDTEVNGMDFTFLRNHLPQVGVHPIRK